MGRGSSHLSITHTLILENKKENKKRDEEKVEKEYKRKEIQPIPRNPLPIKR